MESYWPYTNLMIELGVTIGLVIGKGSQVKLKNRGIILILPGFLLVLIGAGFWWNKISQSKNKA